MELGLLAAWAVLTGFGQDCTAGSCHSSSRSLFSMTSEIQSLKVQAAGSTLGDVVQGFREVVSAERHPEFTYRMWCLGRQVWVSSWVPDVLL